MGLRRAVDALSGNWVLISYFVMVALLGAPGVVLAQSERALEEFFLGKFVVARIDMPATQLGIDVYPDREQVVDFEEYSERIKEYGTALRAGDEVLVTKIKLKGRHIEFQLGGGGFGTIGDVGLGFPESQDEEAQQLEKERVRRQRLGGGSRFNVRYEGGVPEGAKRPAGLISVLSQWIEFPSEQFQLNNGIVVERDLAVPGATEEQSFWIPFHKGMTEEEVEELLGPPTRQERDAESGIEIVRSVYVLPNARVEVQYAEGLLLRFWIESN
jgi:hypothetical protein